MTNDKIKYVDDDKEAYMNEILNGKYIVCYGRCCEETIFHGITRRQAMEQMQKHRSSKIERIYAI